MCVIDKPSGNPTFLPHPELTSPEVNNDIFDSEGWNVLSEKLLDLDSTKDLHPPLYNNSLSGSTTYFSNPLPEEFVDELPLKYDDNLQFDIESDLKEIEFLLYQDKDSSLKDSIDQKNLANLADIFVDAIPEMFTDEHALDYSSPSIFDEYDDDFLEVESDDRNVYDDPFDSKGEKIKESKLLIDELDLPCDFLPPFEYDSFISHDFSRVLEDFDPPFYEPLFFKEVPKSKYSWKFKDSCQRILSPVFISSASTGNHPRWENDPGKLGTALDLIERSIMSEMMMMIIMTGLKTSKMVSIDGDFLVFERGKMESFEFE
nr:hypothetical protein [Tanacetum cinerariifolium]